MDFVANFNLNKNEIEADFEVNQPAEFDAVLEINPSVANWGNITGNLSDQTDLQNALDLKADKSEVEEDITTLDNKIDDVQSDLSGDISELTQTVEDNNTAINNRVDGVVDSFDDDIEEINTNIQNEATTRANNDSLLQGDINTLNTNLTSEINARTSADSGLQSQITQNATDINSLKTTINDYGDIVSHDAADFATSAQGALADTALQPNDNITELNNNAGYITSASLPTVNNNKITIQKNSTDAGSFTLNQSSDKTINLLIPTQASDINAVPTSRKINNKALSSDITLTASDVNALSSSTTINDLTTSAQQDALDSGATSTNIGQIATNTQNITNEVTNRQNADNNLQSQIDAIVASSDVFDIVGTYAELQAYDISTVPVNDIIKVLVDSTHSNAATYYRCVESGGVKSWSYIGSEGAYYTKSEADSLFVEQTTTVNGKALSNNITLTASDVGALPDTTTIPTKTSDLTNDSNFATVSQIPTNNNQLTNGAGYITSSALNGYATENFVTSQGYITGISSSDVTTALGYTPYNSTNPNGYQANVIETIKVNGTALTPTSKAVNITVPSEVTESTVSGWGFTKNTGTVTSVNNTQPVNGNVTISIPDTSTLANQDLSNLSSTGEAKFQTPLVSGTNIKTINSTSLLGSGNIDTSEIFVAEYGTTTFAEVQTAYNAGKTVFAKYGSAFCSLAILTSTTARFTSADTINHIFWVGVTETGWTNNVINLETTSNKVTSISSSSTDTQYPSAKCVYNELDNKQDTLVSGTNIKTINSTSLLGSGNVAVQPTLVSGTNIKTVNNTSLLGSGNIAVQSVISDLAEIRLNASDGSRIYGQISNAGDIITGSSSLNVQMFDGSGIANYQLLDGTTGLIPDARISSNIERTSNKVTSISSSSTDTQYPSAKLLYDKLALKQDSLGFTPANQDLSNLSSTGQKVIDGQWVGSRLELLSGAKSAGTTSYTAELTSYLPNDSYSYEVLLSTFTNAKNSSFTTCTVTTGVCTAVRLGDSRNDVSKYSTNTFTIIVDSTRSFSIAISQALSDSNVTLIAYRRTGTNT